MQCCSRYAELHCTTNFSFLQGGSHPEELVSQAASLGYAALAITDRASLSGVVRAHAAAKEFGVHLIIGAVVEPIDAAPLVLWVINKKGYENLCRLLTTGLLKQDCLKKYGEMTLNARDTLSNAIQLCSKYCSSGRYLKDWELDALMHYFKKNELKVNDIDLTDSGWFSKCLLMPRINFNIRSLFSSITLSG